MNVPRNSTSTDSEGTEEPKNGRTYKPSTGLFNVPTSSLFFSSFPNPFRRMSHYSELAHNEDAESDESLEQILSRQLQIQKLTIWRWRCASFLLLVALVVMGISSILPTSFTTYSPTSSTASGLFISCGNTTNEAHSHECRYNPLSNRWLPERCDLGLAKDAVMEAINHEPFQFWHDPAGEHEITAEGWKQIEMGTTIWTTERHHFAHCVHLLAQSAAALTFGAMAEENARSWDHTKHCVETILSAGRGLSGWNEINSFVHIGSGSCR